MEREKVMRIFGLSALAAAVCLIGFQAQPAHAAGIPWAVPNGTTPGGVAFANGQNQTNLMGSPTPVGNTFFFFPQGFKAQSANGQGLSSASDPAIPGSAVGQAHDRVDVDLTAPAGSNITAVNIFEGGDYTILGSGSVNVTGNLMVLPLVSPAVPPAIDTIHTVPAMPVSTVTGASGNWTGTASVSLAVGGAHSVHFTWDNNLFAVTPVGAGNDAQIEKKQAFSNIIVQIIIPEPGTVSLLLCGAPQLLRRRRSL